MNWLTDILTNPNTFAHNLLVFTVVISIGLFLGRIRVKGISFGATCVLFVGLLVNYLGIDVDHSTLTFMKNFGLVLFVFFIGLQVGSFLFCYFQERGTAAERINDCSGGSGFIDYRRYLLFI